MTIILHTRPVVVVTQNSEGCERTGGKARKHFFRVPKNTWIVAREVTGKDHELGACAPDDIEHTFEVVIVDLPPYVQVAELNEGAANKPMGEIAKR